MLAMTAAAGAAFGLGMQGGLAADDPDPGPGPNPGEWESCTNDMMCWGPGLGSCGGSVFFYGCATNGASACWTVPSCSCENWDPVSGECIWN